MRNRVEDLHLYCLRCHLAGLVYARKRQFYLQALREFEFETARGILSSQVKREREFSSSKKCPQSLCIV